MASIANLVSLSHEVSTEHKDAPVNPIQGPSKPKASTTKPPKTADFTSFKVPKAPPPPQTAALMNKKLKYEREDDQNEQRQNLASKIDDYFSDDILSEILMAANIKQPEPNTKLAELEIIYARIKKAFKRGSKGAFVESTFMNTLRWGETFCVNFLGNQKMAGSAERILSQLPSDVQRDLRIVAVELPDYLIPSAPINLALNIFSAFGREISNVNPSE